MHNVTTLRLIHLNVHRFTSVEPVSAAGAAAAATTSLVADALSAFSPDVVTLNEVDVRHRPGCLEAVADALSLPFVEFFGHVRGSYGNAILSKYPLTRLAAVRLDGGTEFQFPAGTKKFNGDIAKENESHRIVRGLLITDVELPGSVFLRLGITHLDHMDVEQRKKQLRHIVKEFDALDHGENEMEEKKTKKKHSTGSLLMGDLNALMREDYSAQEWQRLEERARSRDWQLPQSGDLQILRDSKFEDVAVMVAGSEAAGLESEYSKGVRLRTAPARDPMYRIDYGWWRSPKLHDHHPAPLARPSVAQVLDDTIVSDHLPFMLDLDIDTEPGLCKL